MFYREKRVVTCGSRLRQNFVPDYTATLLTRLDEAGAIDLGGLNLSEFAANPFGLNILVGRARNPWNPDCITGGSSSGSAAAVAARMVFGSLGSDTGGSVRLPAGACGVVGLLPTRGRISRYGVMPLSFSLDSAGPLTRTVRDCARITKVVAGFDPFDPSSSNRAVPDFEAVLGATIRGLRMGVPKNYYLDEMSDDIRRALIISLDVFRDLGARIVEVDVPDREPLNALANIILLSEAAAIHARALREQGDEYTPVVRNRFQFGFSFPAATYIEALTLRGPLLADYSDAAFTQADVLHMPMLPHPVPLMADIEAQLAGKSDLSFNLGFNTRLHNYLGLPAITLPCGFSQSHLPIGFQLVGPPFSEGLLFSVGHAFQSTTDYHKVEPKL
jgi:aspartyl-tRNA(Asn)/glutamyl-tRNA(Gln) amidotransferase subunit A